MKTIIISTLLAYAVSGIGQSFDQKFQFDLPLHDKIIKVQWADVTNDSLLDVVVGYKIAAQFKIGVFVNGEIEPWPWKELVEVDYSPTCSFDLLDENKDNKIDLVVLNELVLVQYYYNQGNVVFTKGVGWGSREVNIVGWSPIDMNNDGIMEDVWTDGATLSIINNPFTSNHNDTSLMNIKSFKTLDLDKNGFRDLIFCGIDNNAKPLTYIWYFARDFKIINRVYLKSLVGEIGTGDLDHDGDYDIVISGRDSTNKLITQIFKNNKTSFSKMGTAPGLDSATITIADFNSDGLADISFQGKTDSNNAVTWIQTFSGDSISLPSNSLAAQDFGDYDRDGDLDLVQAYGGKIIVRENNPGPANKGPKSATQAIGLQIHGYMFFYWNKPTDDHTPSDAITYDLKVFTQDSVLIASSFDSNHRQRLLVSEGNMGTINYSIQKLQGNYNFEIQSVDNAFVAQSKAICSGVCSTCANIDEQNILTCGGSPAILTPPAPQAMWFSFSKGFLGLGDTYNFEDTKADTIFSFNPSANASCASLRLFNIQTFATDTVRIAHTLYDCIGAIKTLSVSSEWKNVRWKNNLSNSVVLEQSIICPFEENIILTAYASNDLGCQLKEQYNLYLSLPDIQLSGTRFQIIKGNSVQLFASGGDYYLWSPASSLNNNQISNPMASPEETTEYKVIMLDSLGCSDEDSVLVEVFEEAFIPTLFTPNADGKNDNLKIYGLTQASNFRFAIYNREGSKLFETTDIAEATQAGWSGAVRGNTQPPGTYYWKVEGKMPNGELLLNGKKNGAFLLVR